MHSKLMQAWLDNRGWVCSARSSQRGPRCPFARKASGRLVLPPAENCNRVSSHELVLEGQGRQREAHMQSAGLANGMHAARC